MKNLTTFALLWLLACVPALAQTAPQTRAVAPFRAVEVANGIELRLAAGPTQLVTASADTPENQARIKTDVRDGVLRITFERDKSELWGRKNYVRNLRVSVTAPPLASLEASSGANIDVAGPYATDALQLNLSSGGSLTGDLTLKVLKAQLSSGGTAQITGTIGRLDVHTSSGGTFKGDGLRAVTCDASASSGGSIAVAVQETLTAEASSGGDVRYSGSPQVTKHTSSGGSVKSR